MAYLYPKALFHSQIFSRSELQAIADLCIKHDTLCFSDEVYEWLIYKGHEHVKIGMWYVSSCASYLLCQWITCAIKRWWFCSILSEQQPSLECGTEPSLSAVQGKHSAWLDGRYLTIIFIVHIYVWLYLKGIILPKNYNCHYLLTLLLSILTHPLLFFSVE